MGPRLSSSAIAIAIAAVTATACVLFTPLDGYTGGDEPTDAGERADAPSPPPPDASPADGGGVDGGGGGPFCASLSPPATFCSDWDDGVFPSGWQAVVDKGGAVTLDKTSSRSSPFSALFVNATTTSTSRAAIERKIDPIAAEIVVEIDVKVDQKSTAGSYDILTISSGTPEIGFQVFSDGQLAFDEDYADGDGGVVSKETRIPGVLDAEWHRARFDVRIVGTTAAAELTLDGKSVATYNLPTGFAKTPTVILGDDELSAPKADWRVHMDNIAVYVR